jgi:RNA polymerase sigma factor (sigma-70 family)
MQKTEFDQLYSTVFPILFRVAFRICGTEEAAEDLCQEAFFKIHEKNMLFPSQDDAKYWLIRVVKNASLNFAKRKERERKAYQRAFHEGRREQQSAERDYLDGETKKEMQEILAVLPEKLRTVVILKEYAGLNYREIGKTLGITEGNVKVRMFRARKKLAELMGPLYWNAGPEEKDETYVP